jgi:glutamate synthase domain-containing protein 3
LHKPDAPHAIYNSDKQDWSALDEVLDVKLLELAAPALESGKKVEIDLSTRNIDRTTGTILGSEISLKYGPDGLPEDTVRITLRGSAGQSLAAWCTKGMTFVVEGDTNDYAGKGMCGAKLIVKVPDGSTFEPSENIIAGNVVLYGATSGEAYFQGVAGERFCVRNSGASAVVEGVGDHGCEYMTGGNVVILGNTGRNFGAGMSGGFAFVLDLAGNFREKVNHERVELRPLSEEDEATIQRMVRRHHEYTRSTRADEVLRKWNTYAPKFVKVFPKDLKLALDARLEAHTGDG